MESPQSPARLKFGIWSGCPAMVIICCNLVFKVSRPYYYGRHFHEIVCPRRISALTLPAKSRAFYCWLKIWLPIVYVVLDYCLCDQHMLYGHLGLLTLRYCLINLEHMAFACSSDFPFAVRYRLVYTNTCITVL